MLCVAIVLLGVCAVAVTQDDQKYMIRNTDSNVCLMTSYTDPPKNIPFLWEQPCDTTQVSQRFYIKEVAGGNTAFTIHPVSLPGSCLLMAPYLPFFIFFDGVAIDDCIRERRRPPPQTPNGVESSFFIKRQANGFHLESTRYLNLCLHYYPASFQANFSDSCGTLGTTWSFDPDFSTGITDPTGSWDLAASNNGDITKSLTTGMQWTDSSTVTNTDQVGFSYALEASAEFMGVGTKVTMGANYAHTWSTEVMQSSTTTSTEECSATCHLSDLPPDSPGWNLFQWGLSGKAPKGIISAKMCQYLCLPQPMQPQCPVNCCHDRNCQTCIQSCFKDGANVPVVVV